MDPVDLEKIVDRELNALPQPAAPPTLLPRVMAAVMASRSMPWYSRAWFTWPTVWQAGSVAALIILVIALVRLGPIAGEAAEIVRANATLPTPGWVVASVAWAQPFWDAAQILWRVMVEPIRLYVLVFLFLMTTACVVFGTALNRVALGGASEL